MYTINKISDLMEEKGLKQKDLTDYLGINKNVYTGWKSGRIKSYTKYLPQIAEFLDVSVDYLLGNTSTKKSPDSENQGIEVSSDVAKHMERIMKELEQEEALMFDGEPLDEESLELIRASLKNAYAIAMAKKPIKKGSEKKK